MAAVAAVAHPDSASAAASTASLVSLLTQLFAAHTPHTHAQLVMAHRLLSADLVSTSASTPAHCLLTHTNRSYSPTHPRSQTQASGLPPPPTPPSQLAMAHRLLSADLVSTSASLGRPTWEAASRFYAAQQERAGQVHVAAMHLLAVGAREEAAAVYRWGGARCLR